MFNPAEVGITGVTFFSIGHAISSIGLLYLVGLFYDRRDARVQRFEFINSFKEFINFYLFTFVTVMLNIGCTGSILYVAESLMMSGLTAKK
jgi:NADH:ubiquinone oxidoreductase subunit 4 (subunit M)